jgi:hypothetical protein
MKHLRTGKTSYRGRCSGAITGAIGEPRRSGFSL